MFEAMEQLARPWPFTRLHTVQEVGDRGEWGGVGEESGGADLKGGRMSRSSGTSVSDSDRSGKGGKEQSGGQWGQKRRPTVALGAAEVGVMDGRGTGDGEDEDGGGISYSPQPPVPTVPGRKGSRNAVTAAAVRNWGEVKRWEGESSEEEEGDSEEDCGTARSRASSAV